MNKFQWAVTPSFPSCLIFWFLLGERFKSLKQLVALDHMGWFFLKEAALDELQLIWLLRQSINMQLLTSHCVYKFMLFISTTFYFLSCHLSVNIYMKPLPCSIILITRLPPTSTVLFFSRCFGTLCARTIMHLYRVLHGSSSVTVPWAARCKHAASCRRSITSEVWNRIQKPNGYQVQHVPSCFSAWA